MFGEEKYIKEMSEKILDKYSLEEALQALDMDPQDALFFLIDYGYFDDEDLEELLDNIDDQDEP